MVLHGGDPCGAAGYPYDGAGIAVANSVASEHV